MYETIGMIVFFASLALIAWATGTDVTYKGHVGPTSIFRIGDTVQLKSGGPDMLVTAICEANETVLCQWRDETHTTRGEFFPAVCLVMLHGRTTFKVGDLVRESGGGPIMHVMEIDHDAPLDDKHTVLCSLVGHGDGAWWYAPSQLKKAT